jgi:hypothetical protein
MKIPCFGMFIQNLGMIAHGSSRHRGGEEISVMIERTKQLFVAHPEALNESYGQHFSHAMRYSGRMFAASLCAFTHAIFPFLFEKTASNMVKKMYADMTSRGATAPVSHAAATAAAALETSR